MRIKKLIAASAAVVMLASNQTAMTGVSYAAEAVAESQIVYGEVNGDGKVSLSDAVAILQYIANRDKYPLSAKAVLNADCVDHGDGVTGMDALALKLIDANMLKAEDLPVTSQKIQECINPQTTEEALLFDEVYTFGVYNAETKAIDIEWLVNETVKEVEIFVSDNNQKYVSVAKVKDEAKYSYEVKEDFDTKFFKVSYTDKEGKLHESFPFFIKAKEDNYVTEFFDADEDGIFDMFESAYGCKIDEADTDKDGLSDYEEVYITQTDPAVSDSFKKGVSDADADCDEDGISNITELKNGSNPIRKDTDYDGLTDLEEINELKTNPLLRDTDEDGLTDYAERKMGLDPLKPETNGVPDADVVIEQKIDSDAAVLQAVNEDDSNKAYKLSVDMKTAGFAEDNISVSKSSYTNAINSKPLVGGVMDIVIDDSKELDSMKLNFIINDEAKENKLGTYSGLGGIKRLSVFQYNEDIHMLIPMDTEYSEAEGIVSAEIDGTGTYCLVDSEIWFDSHGIMPEEDVPEAPDTESLAMASVADAVIGDEVSIKRNEPFDLYFTLQRSGVSGKENFNYQKKMIHDIASYLFKYYDDAVIHVIPYDVEEKMPSVKENSETCDFTNIIELDMALEKMEYSTELGPADRLVSYRLVEKEIRNTKSFTQENKSNNYRWIVVNLMNGESFNSGYWVDDCYVRDSLIANGVVFGQVYYKTPLDGYLSSDIASYRLFYPGNVMFDIEGLDVAFNQKTNYDEVLGFITRSVRTYNNYKAPCDGGNITVKLRDILSPDSGMDTDLDGICDWDELDKKYMIINSDGTFSFMTHTEVFKKANVNVGKKKEGNKVLQWDDTPYGPQLEKYYNERTVAIWWSHPLLKDSDFDHIPDLLDNAPFNHIDDHFKAVDDYSKVTYRDLLSIEYEEKLKEASASAPALGISAKALNPKTWKDYAAASLFAIGGMTVASSPITYKSFDSIAELGSAYGGMPNASLAMLHYIDGKGFDLYIPDFPFALAETNPGRTRYYYNMNTFFDMVEKNAMIDHKYDFSTVKNINKPGDFEEKGASKKTAWQTDYHEKGKYNINASMDWWYTFGGAQNALSASVYCHRNENGKIVYTAKIRYYVLDVYDWSETDEKELYELHLAGVAKSFLDYGYYETEIEWDKGSRYPIPTGDLPINMDNISFDGISDSEFKKVKDTASAFYFLI